MQKTIGTSVYRACETPTVTVGLRLFTYHKADYLIDLILTWPWLREFKKKKRLSRYMYTSDFGRSLWVHQLRNLKNLLPREFQHTIGGMLIVDLMEEGGFSCFGSQSASCVSRDSRTHTWHLPRCQPELRVCPEQCASAEPFLKGRCLSRLVSLSGCMTCKKSPKGEIC